VAIVYHRGTIIMASQVPDQNGTNPKDRPVVLLIDFEDTHADAYGLAISTTFRTLLPRPRSSCLTSGRGTAKPA
jgi:hypothetical protein